MMLDAQQEMEHVFHAQHNTTRRRNAAWRMRMRARRSCTAAFSDQRLLPHHAVRAAGRRASRGAVCTDDAPFFRDARTERSAGRRVRMAIVSRRRPSLAAAAAATRPGFSHQPNDRREVLVAGAQIYVNFLSLTRRSGWLQAHIACNGKKDTCPRNVPP